MTSPLPPLLACKHSPLSLDSSISLSSVPLFFSKPLLRSPVHPLAGMVSLTTSIAANSLLLLLVQCGCLIVEKGSPHLSRVLPAVSDEKTPFQCYKNLFKKRKILQYHFGTYPKNNFDHWMKMVQSGPSNWFMYFKKI